MRISLLLATSALLFAGAVQAEAPIEPKDMLKQGVAAMRGGDKKAAWELLYPLAQSGEVQAMFHLGEMMLQSPEYDDHLDRAMKFYSVAAKMGHEGAASIIPRVTRMIEVKAAGALPTIAGAAGMPTAEEIQRAQERLKQYTAEVLRFTDRSTDVFDVPRIEVMVFLNKTDSSAESIYRLVDGIQNQFNTKIRSKFFVVINPAEWTPGTAPTGGSSIPPNGFTPDFKGALAAQHGVTSFPSVVILPPSGRPTVIQDLSSLSSTISRML